MYITVNIQICTNLVTFDTQYGVLIKAVVSLYGSSHDVMSDAEKIPKDSVHCLVLLLILPQGQLLNHNR